MSTISRAIALQGLREITSAWRVHEEGTTFQLVDQTAHYRRYPEDFVTVVSDHLCVEMAVKIGVRDIAPAQERENVWVKILSKGADADGRVTYIGAVSVPTTKAFHGLRLDDVVMFGSHTSTTCTQSLPRCPESSQQVRACRRRRPLKLRW